MITINCSHCSRQYKVDDKLAGKRVKCKECGHPILVAANAHAPAVSAGASAPPSDEPDIFGLMEAAEAEAAENQLEAVALKASHSSVHGVATGPAGGPQRACPSCQANVPMKAVICLSCGYNFKTGRTPQAPTHSPHEIPLAEPASAPRRRRVSNSKLRNNDMLNSIDRYLGVAVFILFALGATVWILNVVKTAPAFSIFLLLPTVITTLLFMAIVAPLMLLAMQIIANLLKFAPRTDTYMRVLMVLMLPLGMALLCGASVAKNPGLADMISGSWLAAGVLFVFLFRDDLIPFLATTISGAVAGFIGWGIAVFVSSLVTLATGPLYADALPPGPWQQIASGLSPKPKPPEPKPEATPPVTPTQTVETPPVQLPPVQPPTTQPQVAGNGDATGTPFPNATGANTTEPDVVIPPATVNNGSNVTVIQGGPPDESVLPVIRPRGTNVNPPQQVARNTDVAPPPIVDHNANTGVQNPEIAVGKPIKSPFLTDIQADLPELQGARDVITPLTNTSWMISVKQVDPGTVSVQRWSTDPLTKRGELTFQEIPKKPNTYALSPTGSHLIVLSSFPKWQIEICNFDGKPSKKISITEALPPGEQNAIPTLVGFLDPGHYILRWDLNGRSSIAGYNCPGGERYKAFLADNSDNGTGEWAVSSDGKSLAVLTRGYNNREMVIYDLTSGMNPRKFRTLNSEFNCKGIAWSPDNKKIAVYAVSKDVTTVIAFNQKGESVNTAILPPQAYNPEPMRMRGNADQALPENPHDLLWTKNSNLWVIDGTDLYDAESGRKVVHLGVPGISDQRLIGANSLVLMQKTGEETRRCIPAKIDDSAIRKELDSLRKR